MWHTSLSLRGLLNCKMRTHPQGTEVMKTKDKVAKQSPREPLFLKLPQPDYPAASGSLPEVQAHGSTQLGTQNLEEAPCLLFVIPQVKICSLKGLNKR